MITLKTLPNATAQEVFDQVATHLLKQGERSIEPTAYLCVYKTSEGLSCAAGCLMSDDDYSHDFEQNTWKELTKYRGVPDAHVSLITELQKLHDDNRPRAWRNKLRRIANNHGLNSEVVA